MKIKLLLIGLILAAGTSVLKAQDKVGIEVTETSEGEHRVYAELVGSGNLTSHKYDIVSVDLGQRQAFLRSYHLVEENGKDIKFNSMVAALNFMSLRGWNFIQAYVTSCGKDNEETHWLMYKDVTDESEIYEGLMVSNTDSAPGKKKKADD